MPLRFRELADTDELAVVEPLWNSMREHYEALERRPGPVHDRGASWERRRATYERLLGDEDGFILLAEQGDEVVGYAAVRIQPGSPVFTWTDETGYVETLVVDPQRRGQGIGRELLARVRERLAGRAIGDVSLHVLVTNREALGFYEAEGFRPYCTLLSDAIPPLDEGEDDPSGT